MGGGIPHEAVGVWIAVFLYSLFCLALSTLLVCLLLNYGERWTYVTILCSFTVLSTLASIIQQIHYATSWVVIKEAQYAQAVASLTTPSLAFSGAAQIVDVVLFDIQYYSYNVMSLSIFFWSVSLVYGSWGIRSNWLGDWQQRIPPISKAFTILFPAFIAGIGRVQALRDNTVVYFVVANVTMLISMSVGSILLVLILYKYMKTRRLIAGQARRGGWWATERSKSRPSRDIGADGTTESEGTLSSQNSIYDRALVTRFTIGFVILAAFEALVIVFSLFQVKNNAAIARSGGPNFSLANTISDILFFIPGVTASLVVFLVFGTAKSWRQYRDLVVGCCGLRSKMYERRLKRAEEGDIPGGMEFERLPSIPNSPKAFSQVRMFVQGTIPRKSEEITMGSTSIISAEPSGPAGPPSDVRNLQFHKHRPLTTWKSLPPSPALTTVPNSPANQPKMSRKT